MSLKVKLIALFLLIGIIPLAAIGVISYVMASDALEEEVDQQMEIFAGLKSVTFEGFFDDFEEDAQGLAITQVVSESMNILLEAEEGRSSPEWLSQVAALDGYAQTAKEVFELNQVFITDQEGTVVYDSLNQMVGVNLSGRSYIQGSLGGHNIWSELFYSDILHC